MGRVTAAIRIEPEKVDGRYGSVRCVGLDAPSELRVAFVAEETITACSVGLACWNGWRQHDGPSWT
jgi:hypothetical protein